jgi:hypothetical protein
MYWEMKLLLWLMNIELQEVIQSTLMQAILAAEFIIINSQQGTLLKLKR